MSDRPKSQVSPANNPVAMAPDRQTTKAEERASASMRPAVQTGLTLTDYNSHFGELSLSRLVSTLEELNDQVSKGDLSQGETLLLTQAQALDAIFHKLARDASRSDSTTGLEVQLRLALKAQSQCRATIETLAAMKNPRPVAFVQQANIANGPQQVNNGVAVRQLGPEPPAAIENPQNKLLETQDGERLDAGATGSAGSADPKLAAVAALLRTKDAQR